MRSRIGAGGARCKSKAHKTASLARPTRHETVALALFDRPHPVVGGDDVGDGLIEARESGGHLLGLVYHRHVEPSTSPRSSPHRSNRRSPLTPRSLQFTQRRVRAWVDLAHASQHRATTSAETSAEVRRALAAAAW